jgi:hypothetical protein
LKEVLIAAGTILLPASFNWKRSSTYEAGSIVSLNTAVTIVPVLTPVALFNGDTDDTIGGVNIGSCATNQEIFLMNQQQKDQPGL